MRFICAIPVFASKSMYIDHLKICQPRRRNILTEIEDLQTCNNLGGYPGTRVTASQKPKPGSTPGAATRGNHSTMTEENDDPGGSSLYLLCAALLGLFAGYGVITFGFQIAGGSMLPLVPQRPCGAAPAAPAQPVAPSQRALGPRLPGGAPLPCSSPITHISSPSMQQNGESEVLALGMFP